MAILYFIIFFWGASIVSFFNLYDERRRRGEDWIFSRSHCDCCGDTLHWVYLIPVLGAFISRGRCSCGAKISLFHPLTETVGGSLAVFLFFYSAPGDCAGIYMVGVFFAYLLAIEDVRFQDVYTRDLFFSGVLFTLGTYLRGSIYLLSGLFLCVLVGALFFLFPKGIGEGDIYYSGFLALGIDGIWNSYLFFTSTFVLAALVGGGLYLMQCIKERTIPMFPFFFAAYLLVEIFLS
ncbi:MAG: prepilin peptidase [Peptoniphilus sp.]|nr:prepilin peptidase [Peptoniphilus sp.]MDY3118048.1 prepilin peptidase [Peptoniphilus sp.]